VKLALSVDADLRYTNNEAFDGDFALDGVFGRFSQHP
jgi:hypothetical protein